MKDDLTKNGKYMFRYGKFIFIAVLPFKFKQSVENNLCLKNMLQRILLLECSTSDTFKVMADARF